MVSLGVVFSFALTTVLAQVPPSDVTHGILYDEPGDFAGWPANEGIWTWDDGREVLVGFEVSGFEERPDTHNVDRESPKRIVFGRSQDGGRSWQLEEHPEIAPPAYMDDPALFAQASPTVPDPTQGTQTIDFTQPDFAMKLRNDAFYFSYDRGHNWRGPYLLPHIGHERLLARSCYLVDGPSTCKLFFSVSPFSDGNHNRSLMAETTDGGLNFEFVSWIAPAPHDEAPDAKNTFSTMPSALRMPDESLIVALRQRIDNRKWTDMYRSTDDGRTWSYLCTPEKGSTNPPALVSLGGQRVALVYGCRAKPLGLRAQISEDGGATWSDQYILRDDGYEWDLGYVRAALMNDGRVLAVYYYTTEKNREQHIAYTLWRPPAPNKVAR